EVAVPCHDDLAAGQVNPRRHRRRLTVVGPELDDAEPRVFLREGRRKRSRFVPTAVVDEQDFVLEARAVQRIRDTAMQKRDTFGFVIKGYDYRYVYGRHFRGTGGKREA